METSHVTDDLKPEFAEYEKANRAAVEDPDDFEAWEKLVRTTEQLEGGLTRNSSPQAIAATRGVFDRFLARFPLLFGYWKKYADLEFSIAGTEAAEMVCFFLPFCLFAFLPGTARGINRRRLMLAGFICRYMSVESLVLPTLSIYGQTIAISKSRLAMIPMLSESKSLMIKNDPLLQRESIGCAISPHPPLHRPLFTPSHSCTADNPVANKSLNQLVSCCNPAIFS